MIVKYATMVALVLGAHVWGNAQNERKIEEMQSYRFSLIRVPVWFEDIHKHTHYGPADFELSINGRPVTIENVAKTFSRPMNLVYLLDISGSMDIGGKLEGSIQAISYLLKRHHPDDQWQIVVFADQQVVKVLDHTQRKHWPELKKKIEAYGKTALFDALAYGERFFDHQSHAARGILLFTDGNDNQSVLTRKELFTVLQFLEAPVFIVGIADGFIPNGKQGLEKLGLQTLKEITTISGGELFLAKDRSQLPQIAEMLRSYMRPQYLLTITVERGPGERRQDIEVRLKNKPRTSLRHRNGYIGLEPQFIGGNQ